MSIAEQFKVCIGINYIEKILSYKNYVLMIVMIPLGIFLDRILNILVQSLDLDATIITLIIFAILTSAYFIVTLLDFAIGLLASRKEGKKIKSNLLWRTVFKTTGTLLVTSIVTIFALIFSLIGLKTFYTTFNISLISLYFIAISFELHSIGENQERLYHKKPPFFHFFDKILTAIEEGFINKVKNWFK